MRSLQNTLQFLACLPIFLGAEEPHEEVGLRKIPEKEIANQEESTEEESCSGFVYDRHPTVYFPASSHWIAAVSGLGESLELEDGSVWAVGSSDRYKTLNWRSTDPLVITQNTSWFTNYNYRIINQNTGSSVEANLSLGPIQNGIYTRYIIHIDSINRLIQLSDATHWDISYLDTAIFRNWATGDAVIIGVNSSWDPNSEALLINVNMNNSVRAKQF